MDPVPVAKTLHSMSSFLLPELDVAEQFAPWFRSLERASWRAVVWSTVLHVVFGVAGYWMLAMGDYGAAIGVSASSLTMLALVWIEAGRALDMRTCAEREEAILDGTGREEV